MAPTFEFITSATPSGVYFVDLLNIPQNYDHLVVLASTRSVGTGSYYQTLGLAAQWQSEALHNTKRLFYVNNGLGSDSYTNNYQMYPGLVTETDSTAGCFAHNELWIYNYTKPQNKVIATFAASETNGTYGVIMDTLGTYLNNKPVTQLLLFVLSGQNFASGTRFSVYGVRGAEDSDGRFMQATGGDVTVSGGYKYHVFRSSGVFTVAQPGWAEVLVVGGGGGAAYGKTGTYFGVPGGAGQVQLFSSLLQSSPYMVAVGAGGAGAGSTLDVNGSGGTMSSLGSLVASGGGGGLFNTGVGGSSGNGFTGGNPSSANTGGGGGATASGANATGGGGGAGGAGTSAYSAWGVATSTGQDVSGTRWYGGGGGGTTNGAGGNGGGGASKAAGSANTGGGAGGGEYAAYPALAGGSGIVIIRYPAT